MSRSRKEGLTGRFVGFDRRQAGQDRQSKNCFVFLAKNDMKDGRGNFRLPVFSVLPLYKVPVGARYNLKV